MNRAAGDRGTIQVGQRAIPVWLALTVAGAALWLGIMFVDTGAEGFDATRTALAYLVPLVLLASFTRTVSLQNLVTMVLAGGFMLGVALLAIKGFEAYEDDPAATSRDVAVPIIEETLKLVPVLLFLWIGRKARTWSLAATDLLLLGAASGAGFGLVEDAYIRDRFGWADQVSWLPLAEISGGRVIAGHAVWSSVGALTIGYALLLRSRGPATLAVAVAGVAWSIFDHAVNNYAAGRETNTAENLQNLAGDGWITIWALVLGGIAALVVDFAIQRRTLAPIAELKPPAGLTRASWAYRVAHRALAMAAFQHYRRPGPAPSGAEEAIRALAGGLYAARQEPGTLPRAAEAAGGK